jgi:prepilin-type N-terminal cleavage/methylation domain-containing protein
MMNKPTSNSCSSRTDILNRAGFTLIEIMIAAAIMGVLVMGFTEFVARQNLVIKGTRALAERDALVNRLSRIAGNPVALTNSANDATNSSNQFHDCVLGGGSGTACNMATCSAAAPCGLTLLDSTAPTGIKVAGPPNNPQYYDLTGAPCTPFSPKDSNCAIQAIAQYYPNCGVAGSPCSMARDITVKYTIQQTPGILLAAGPTMQPASNTVVSMIPLGGGQIGAWATFSTVSGAPEVAPADGFLIVTSALNRGIKIDVNGTQRLFVSARDKYGQGFVSATLPLSKGENFTVSSIDVSQSVDGSPLSSVYFRPLQ